VGVELGRRQVLVPEELLHNAQVCATLQQVCGVRVAKSVRMHMTESDTFVEHATHIAYPETNTAVIQKQSPRRTALGHRVATTHISPLAQRHHPALVQRHEPFLPTLASDGQEAASPLHVVDIERTYLGHAQPRAVEDFADGAIT
jgi:hypothetical protein